MSRYELEVKPSPIDGRGLFAKTAIPARRKIGELTGTIISEEEARRKAQKITRIAIVEFGDGRALDASMGGNEFRYINHSCSPNTFMRVCYSHVEFYAKRDIAVGEELTCDYGDTHHDGKKPCQCGAEHCRNFL